MGIKDLKPRKNSHYKQGYFIPKNPDKYVGPDKRIIYRSKLEFKFCTLCDTDRRVMEWASEPFFINYYNPVKKRPAKYYPDYYVKVIQKDGTIKVFVIEVKPMELTPQKVKRPSKYASKKQWNSYYYKLRNIAINTAKYKASKKWCETRKAAYMFITEQFFEQFR